MSVTQPPVEPRETGRPADDLDGLLREFFQAELPRPWPAFARPGRATMPLPGAPSWRLRFRSSLALAASLILLALSLGLLSGRSTPSPQSAPEKGPIIGAKDTPRHGPIRPEKN
jgi:hypothetical protein